MSRAGSFCFCLFTSIFTCAVCFLACAVGFFTGVSCILKCRTCIFRLSAFCSSFTFRCCSILCVCCFTVWCCSFWCVCCTTVWCCGFRCVCCTTVWCCGFRCVCCTTVWCCGFRCVCCGTIRCCGICCVCIFFFFRAVSYICLIRCRLLFLFDLHLLFKFFCRKNLDFLAGISGHFDGSALF